MNATTAPLHLESAQPVTHQQPVIAPLDRKLLNTAKCAFTTRRVDFSRVRKLITAGIAPDAGQLVLARIRRIRQHARIELVTGRRSHLFPKDLVVLAYGNRYATDQFEARIPAQLGPCHMVAAGGIASEMISRNARIKPATEIEPLGLLADEHGNPLNLNQFALPAAQTGFPRTPAIAVVGSSMNAGKTTAAADLIYGLTHSGLRVAAAKITGTGSGGDVWLMTDAGATEVVDFTDAGHPSTDQVELPQLADILTRLTAHLEQKKPDITVIEVADGIYQQETAQLLNAEFFRAAVDGILYTSGDMVGAVSGSQWLLDSELPVIGIAGKVTQSELAVREVMAASELPVYSRHHLQDGAIAVSLWEFLQSRQRTRQQVAG